MKKYKVIKESPRTNVGEILVKCSEYDYGIARDDTDITGVEHWSMSRDLNGGYPFTTVPVNCMEELPN